VRAATEHRDYQITVHDHERYACVGGIRSTGLTASLAIAEHVVKQMGDGGLSLVEAEREPEIPDMPELAERGTRAFEDPQKVETDPAYDHIVCFCERVTDGELRDALTSPVPATDLGGVSRRTRATNGRCQGFFCGAAIAARLAAR
jgi:glycerol-3-phosphate dehydrogenase